MAQIFFAHANGFPAQAYRFFVEQLKPHQIFYTPILGSGEFAPQKSWNPLAKQLIADLESQATEPVFGLGHSLGGIVTLMAAAQRPDLFQKVIIMDPPIFNPLKRALINLITVAGLAPWLNPVAKKARNRRTHFSDSEEARNYWSGKSFFQDFHPQCFADYIKYGLTSNGEKGLTLTIPADLEYDLFVTTPSIIPPDLKRPAGWLLWAQSGNVLGKRDLAYLQKHFTNLPQIPVEGGHMFPLERPQETAALIRSLIGQG